MSTSISITLDAATKIVGDLDALPEKINRAVVGAMDDQNTLTVSHIQQAYLSFPKSGPAQPTGLRFQSGRLRNSLRATAAQIVAGNVVSSIGTNVVSKSGVSYPAVHEFGAEIPEYNGTTKKGKPWKRKAFSLPARGMIQRGIADRLPRYRAAISAGVVAAWKQ